jgi:hypothetical protein
VRERAPSWLDRWGLVEEAVWKLGLLEETDCAAARTGATLLGLVL